MTKKRKKKRKQVRQRNWEDAHEFAFTHDRARHRRAQPKITETPASGIPPLPFDFEPNATVVSHTKKWAFVQVGEDEEERLCRIDERLEEGEETLLAPGDRILVEFEHDEGIVRGVSPRRTTLSRPGHEHARLDRQVIAANADLLVVVAAAERPPFRPGLVDRFLIAAELGGVQPVLCVNKMDLVESEPPEVQPYRDLGFPVFMTSCETGEGIAELRVFLQGKLSVLAGHSGVGKSSLLNALDPDLKVVTREVSEATQRGRHTTTASRLYELEGGIRVIDTPGIRALGLWDVSAEEVAYYFPEIAEASAGCKFRDCTHVHEPQCAVREAVEAGAVLRPRYESYLRIRASLESDTGTTPGRKAPQGPELPERP